jgi:hypothetical protein
MGRRGKRKTLANIYEDKTGRAGIWYDAAGKAHEARYPPNAQIADIRDDLLLRRAEATASGSAFTYPGTLSAAVNEWEPLEKGLVSWRERRAELRAWCRAEVHGERVGDFLVAEVTERIARIVISQWAVAGVAPKTIRNRLWSLRHLYKVTLGQKAPTPVDDIRRPPKTKTIPGILRDAKTRARFMVRASTGRRPAEIMRAQPGDVDLELRTWRVRDAKGGWTPSPLPLNEDMVEAWRVFIEADAWGDFNTGSMAEVLSRSTFQPERPSTRCARGGGSHAPRSVQNRTTCRTCLHRHAPTPEAMSTSFRCASSSRSAKRETSASA